MIEIIQSWSISVFDVLLMIDVFFKSNKDDISME